MKKSEAGDSSQTGAIPNARLVLENLEEEQLRRNLEMTDTERFYKMMRLVRIHHMLKNAEVVHKTEKPDGYYG